MKSGVYEFTTDIHLQFENKYVFCYREENRNIKKICPQHIKNLDERSLKILCDHEEPVFEHILKRYLKKMCESFKVNEKFL